MNFLPLSVYFMSTCSAGAGSWLADRNPLDVFTVFDHRQVVYLSPDAEEPLEEVLATEVYVVGGIVDRNIDKGLTLAAAKGGGARAVRLPFDEHLPEVPPGDRVLTVCACVGVLMSIHAGEDWRLALKKSVPKRSLANVIRRARSGALREAEGLLSGWEAGSMALAPGRDSTCTRNSNTSGLSGVGEGLEPPRAEAEPLLTRGEQRPT